MTDCTISRSLRLLCLVATAALAAARSVDKRTGSVQSNATCLPSFAWADNKADLSPCLLTAYVWGACFTGGWTVPVLQPKDHYDNPNSTTANTCTCSWAAYNLISACTSCQGLDASVSTWAGYMQDCTNFLTDTYFPVKLPTTIPFWAGTDPTTWTNGEYNSAQAQAVANANEDKPDLVPGPNSSGGKSKPPIGAIVGGVVGGVAVLAIGAAIVFWFIRKSKQRQQNRSSTAGSARPYVSRPHIHNRSMSDLSSKSILSPHAMSVVHSQRPGTMYTTGTMHTHTGSAHSLSYMSGLSPTPGTAMLSPQVHITPGPEEIIEPFNLGQRPTSPPITVTRKGSETTLSTTYTTQEAAGSSSASAPAGAAAAAAAALFMQTVPEDGEHHPPAYTPYASPSPSPEPASPPASPTPMRMGHHQRYQKGSVDTHASFDSTTSYGGRGDSITAVADVIQRMGLGSPPSPSVIDSAAGATTVATGESRNIGARPLKPNVTNPDS